MRLTTLLSPTRHRHERSPALAGQFVEAAQIALARSRRPGGAGAEAQKEVDTMAIFRRAQDPERAITRARGWDPFEMMQDLMRWDPFREMSRRMLGEEPGAFVPTFDVKETKDSYVF